MRTYPLFAKLAAFGLALIFTFSCSGGDDNEPGSGSYTEKGNDIANYKIKQIGTQVWMTENLSYNVSGSVCYDNDPANCTKYGRLYDWATAMDLDISCNYNSCSSQIAEKHRGICPANWHLPSDAEWDILVNYAGDSSTAGGKLKTTSGWNNDELGLSGNGTDDFGFAALPSGRGFPNGDFRSVGYAGYWWSASENGADYVYLRFMSYDYEGVNRDGNDGKYRLRSVRCVKD
ncbi:MAG: fibrobacter succinogenes major paralogous domain-containing protein [Fibromonadaceae bacterium]|jgi:uncharacterized protein (TIGR02145 family)|nr:fibrobacter succinogenes major paralogous domain-containing protein [Fibromonadaceae bacterium]